MLINSFNQNSYQNKPNKQQKQVAFGLSPEYLRKKADAAFADAVRSPDANIMKTMKRLRQNNKFIDGVILREEMRKTGKTFKEAGKVVDEMHAWEAEQVKLAKTVTPEYIRQLEEQKKAPVRTFFQRITQTVKLAVKNMLGNGE